MRFFILSFLMHALLLVAGFIVSRSEPTTVALKNSQTMIEIISLERNLQPIQTSPRYQNSLANKNKKKGLKKERLERKQNLTALTNSATKNTKKVEGPPSDSRSDRERAVALSYTQELKVFLEKNKHYPRQAIQLKQTGVVQLQVKIGLNGVFEEVHLTKTSAFPLLDQAAIDLINRLGRFKPLPEKLHSVSHFTIPIAYIIGGS